MILLDGKKVANDRNLMLKELIEKDILIYHRPPSLSIILVGENPASQSYVKGKGKACKLVGISHELYQLDESVSEEELTNLIMSEVRKELEIIKKDFTPKEPEDLMSRKDVCDLFNISMTTVHTWMNSKIIKPYKMGNKTFFSRKELVSILYSSNTENND